VGEPGGGGDGLVGGGGELQHESEMPLGVGQQAPARPEHLECEEHDSGRPTELEL
jgi:hypothetical protein